MNFAHSNNVTQIVIGKSTRSRWFEILHGSVVHDLELSSGNISVHVIAGEHAGGEPIPKKTVRTAEEVRSFSCDRLPGCDGCDCRGALYRRTDQSDCRHRERRSPFS